MQAPKYSQRLRAERVFGDLSSDMIAMDSRNVRIRPWISAGQTTTGANSDVCCIAHLEVRESYKWGYK